MKYLGIDFGLRRIGLATSEGTLASPWKIVDGKGVKDLENKVSRIVQEEGFDRVVVGMPEGEMGKVVKRLVKSLKAGGLDVVASDETLSTRQATAKMIEQNIPKIKRRINDAHSAAIILQNYLDR